MLGHMVVLFLVFLINLFSTMAAPIYIPTYSVQGFPFLHIFANICYLYSFLMIASRSFMVSGLAFMSLIHFKLNLYMALKNVQVFSSFLSAIYWRDFLFSIVYSCFLSHRVIDHKWVGYFWALYFGPLFYESVLVPVLYCFDYCSFIV